MIFDTCFNNKNISNIDYVIKLLLYYFVSNNLRSKLIGKNNDSPKKIYVAIKNRINTNVKKYV